MKLDICGRCLVVLDARSGISAVKGDDLSEPTSFRRSRELARWAAAKIADGWTIQIDDTTRRFEAVTTWYGDPVCEVHLYWLVDQEQRPESYISSGRWRNR